MVARLMTKGVRRDLGIISEIPGRPWQRIEPTPLGIFSSNPADRGMPGTKRNAIVGADDAALRVVIDRANAHDAKPLEATIESVVAERPNPTPEPA